MTARVQNQVVPLNALSENNSHFEGGVDTESPSKTTLTNCLLAIRVHLSSKTFPEQRFNGKVHAIEHHLAH